MIRKTGKVKVISILNPAAETITEICSSCGVVVQRKDQLDRFATLTESGRRCPKCTSPYGS